MRKVLVMGFVFSLAIVSTIPTSGQRSQNPLPAPSTKPSTNVGPALPRIVHAPLVRSEELPYAEIALNNRSPQPTEVTLTFYSKHGEPAEPVKRTLQPGEVKHIDVDDLLPAPLKHQRELGGVFVQYTGQWNQVASQLTLISADRKSSIDQPLRPDTDFRSGVQDAVWYMPNDGDAAIVLGNTSGERITATLFFPDGESKQVRLRGYETEIIRLHRDSRRASRREERVQSVRVETSAPAGALRAVGYVTFRGFARTIRFYDRATVRQPDLFAANLSTQNSEIQIVLKNISDKPLTATPRFLPVGPGAGSGTPQSPLELPAITLAPGEEALVDTVQLEQLAAQNEAYSRVGVHVRNSGEKGTLIGSLASFNRRERLSFEIPLRDSGSLRNSGGSYPIRLDDDYSTYVSLMNVSNETVEFTGIIRHPKGEYVFKPRKLQAGESALFDIQELRDKKTPDPNGKTLPADFERGQFNWSMHQGGTVPKLIGRSQIVSKSRGVSSSYSCPICCPNRGPFQAINPFQLSTLPGGLQFFAAASETVNCYGGYYSWPTNIGLTPGNPSIANYSYLQEGQGQANGYSPGTTDFQGDPYWVDDYWDDGMDCYYFPYQAQGPIVNVDVVPAVSIQPFDAVGENNVRLVTVTVTPLPSSDPVKLTLRATTGSGQAYFADTLSSTKEITENTSVAIWGYTRSSTRDNIELVAEWRGGPLASEKFSVIFVTIELRTSGTTSLDNSARNEYALATGSHDLGTFFAGGTPGLFTVTGVELKGTVEPSDFTGRIVPRRDLLEVKEYEDSTLVFAGEPRNDDSFPPRRDEDPQSGGSHGVVYDVDAPGTKTNGVAIRRVRMRFQQWAEFDGMRVSDMLFWNSRLSVESTQFGDRIRNDVPGDNVAAVGTIRTTWNLQ